MMPSPILMLTLIFLSLAACAERSREAESSAVSPLSAPAEVTVEEPQHSPAVEEESGILVPNSGLLQVTERRREYSMVHLLFFEQVNHQDPMLQGSSSTSPFCFSF